MGKVILLTGASSGIGRATATRLARAGHIVYAGLRNLDAGDDLKAETGDAVSSLHPILLDVRNATSIGHAVSDVLSAHGRVDVLINNAGIARGSSVEETDIDVVREMFETNFFGAAELTKRVILGMRERGEGTIVNVTSIGGRLVTVSGAYYAASKYAFEAFSEALAMQLAEFGIRVRIIEPGATTTSMFTNARKAAPAVPSSPYKRLSRRFLAYFNTQLNKPDATPSDDVARVIEHAIATDDDQLRYVVGEDARLLLAGRNRMSDEELIGYCRLEDDDSYFDAMANVHGRDLFRP